MMYMIISILNKRCLIVFDEKRITHTIFANNFSEIEKYFLDDIYI